jgi:excisionase family DNA binding protein
MSIQSDNATPRPYRVAHSIAEVCAATGLGRDGVYNAINAGRLTARKFGRRTVILDHDLRAFLDALPKLEVASS